MNSKTAVKIRNKGMWFHKHGKHKGLKEISIIFNKRRRFMYVFVPIDMSCGNWSSFRLIMLNKNKY